MAARLWSLATRWCVPARWIERQGSVWCRSPLWLRGFVQRKHADIPFGVNRFCGGASRQGNTVELRLNRLIGQSAAIRGGAGEGTVMRHRSRVNGQAIEVFRRRAFVVRLASLCASWQAAGLAVLSRMHARQGHLPDGREGPSDTETTIAASAESLLSKRS